MLPDEARRRVNGTKISPMKTITEAVSQLERAETGVLLLCDPQDRLLGILTDGDVRRAILRGVKFDQPCGTIASSNPVVGREETTPTEALQLMDRSRDFIVHQLPLVDAQNRVVGLVLRSDLVRDDGTEMAAVIMAGGYGTRLRPLTERVPKPMLPVGDRPLLELTIERLREAGIRQVHVTTHYLPDEIRSHFGDGKRFGVEMTYLSEDRPLGTAGGLSLMEDLDQPVLVVNGDIVTHVNFRDMLAFHRRHGADLTVGVRRYQVDVPYGVLQCDGALVQSIQEKPQVTLLINAGLYLMEPSVRSCIPAGERFDMTDLMTRLLADGRTVASFPILEYWLDVGRPDDYARAQEDIKRARGEDLKKVSGS